MNICSLPSLNHLGASTCTNITFSKINDISCVSQLLSENVEKEWCTLLTINRSSLGKDLHLPSVQRQPLLTLQGTSGPCPVTNKNCQQNHSTQCGSITKEFTSPELCWREHTDNVHQDWEAGLWDGDEDLKFFRWGPLSHNPHHSMLPLGLMDRQLICTKVLIPPGTISITGTSPRICLV